MLSFQSSKLWWPARHLLSRAILFGWFVFCIILELCSPSCIDILIVFALYVGNKAPSGYNNPSRLLVFSIVSLSTLRIGTESQPSFKRNENQSSSIILTFIKFQAVDRIYNSKIDLRHKKYHTQNASLSPAADNILSCPDFFKNRGRHLLFVQHANKRYLSIFCSGAVRDSFDTMARTWRSSNLFILI